MQSISSKNFDHYYLYLRNTATKFVLFYKNNLMKLEINRICDD